MQATGTLRRFTISGQVIVLLAVLSVLLIASAFVLGRATQTAAPTAKVSSGQAKVLQGVQTEDYGIWLKGRQAAEGRSGPQVEVQQGTQAIDSGIWLKGRQVAEGRSGPQLVP